jgi:hypothetical protein
VGRHGITAFARAHAREGGEGGWGQCETRICSSKRAASRSACKLPSSFCTPVLYPFASVRGQRWRLRRMHPGPEIKSPGFNVGISCQRLKLLDIKNGKMGVGFGFMRRNGGDRRNEAKRDEPRDRLGPRGRKGRSRLEPDSSGLLVFWGFFFSAGLERAGWIGLCNVRARHLRLRRPPRLSRGTWDCPGWSPRVRDLLVFLGLFSRLGWRVGWDAACVPFVQCALFAWGSVRGGGIRERRWMG